MNKKDGLMEYTNLYNIAEESGIRIDEFELCAALPAMSIKCGKNYAIAIDTSQLTTLPHRKTALAHELGHCMTDAFYNERNILDLYSRQEYRADKWAIKKLLPKSEVERAIKGGCHEVWELAEKFDVTEQLIRKAIWLYFDKLV